MTTSQTAAARSHPIPWPAVPATPVKPDGWNRPSVIDGLSLFRRSGLRRHPQARRPVTTTVCRPAVSLGFVVVVNVIALPWAVRSHAPAVIIIIASFRVISERGREQLADASNFADRLESARKLIRIYSVTPFSS